jgi:DNA-binding TFAR19-related protein (PDSD5 family)
MSEAEDIQYSEQYKKELKKILEKKRKDEEIKKLMAKILEGDAYERLMNVKISNYELYMNVVNNLIYFYQKVGRKISDEELLMLLEKFTKKREGEIKFYRK